MNKKITELTELTVPDSEDVLVIVDISGNETKKIKKENLFDGYFDSANFVDEEVPAGLVDGMNNIFTLAYDPLPNSVKVYVNGQRMANNADYTISGKVITMATPPPATTIILVDYKK